MGTGKIIKFIMTFVLVICLMPLGLACDKTRSEKEAQDADRFLLTITQNEYEDSPFLNTKACLLDKKTGEIEIIATVEHNSSYSLSYYDEKNKDLYYTSNTDEERTGGDQLFCYDIKSKKSTQLTDSLYGINYILPMKDNKLFLAAIKSGTHNISPLSYDLASGKLTDLEWDGDFFVSLAQRDAFNGDIYISGYSNSEDYKMLDLYNSEEITEDYGIDNTVYLLDRNSHKKVFQLEKRYIDSFAVNAGKLICKSSLQGSISGSDKQVILYDLETKKQEILKGLDVIGEIFFIDEDATNVYSNTGESILKTNLSTKEQEVIFQVDLQEEYINNAQ